MKIGNFSSPVSCSHPSSFAFTKWNGRHIAYVVLGSVALAIIIYVYKKTFPNEPPNSSNKPPLREPLPNEMRIEKHLPPNFKSLFYLELPKEKTYSIGFYHPQSCDKNLDISNRLFSHRGNFIQLSDRQVSIDDLSQELKKDGFSSELIDLIDFCMRKLPYIIIRESHFFSDQLDKFTIISDDIGCSISKVVGQEQALIQLKNFNYQEPNRCWTFLKEVDITVGEKLMSDRGSLLDSFDRTFTYTRFIPLKVHPARLLYLYNQFEKFISQTKPPKNYSPQELRALLLARMNLLERSAGSDSSNILLNILKENIPDFEGWENVENLLEDFVNRHFFSKNPLPQSFVFQEIKREGNQVFLRVQFEDSRLSDKHLFELIFHIQLVCFDLDTSSGGFEKKEVQKLAIQNYICIKWQKIEENQELPPLTIIEKFSTEDW